MTMYKTFHDMQQYYWCNGFMFTPNEVLALFGVRIRNPGVLCCQEQNFHFHRVGSKIGRGPGLSTYWPVFFTFIVAPKESVNCEDTSRFPIFTIQIRNYWEGLSHTLWQMLFPIPQRDFTIGVWLHQEYSLQLRLWERGWKMVLQGFCSNAKPRIQKIGMGKASIEQAETGFKFVAPRFLAASFDFTCPATGCVET